MSLDPLSYLLSSSTLNVKRTNHFETTWFDQRVPSLLIFWRRTTKKKKLTYVFRCDVELIYLLFFIPNGNRIAFASGEQHKRTQTDFTIEYNIQITFLLYPLFLLPTTWYFTSSTTPRKKVMVEWVEVVKRRNRSKSGLKYHGGAERNWQNWHRTVSQPLFCDLFNEFTFAALSITKCYAYNQINSAFNHPVNQSLLYIICCYFAHFDFSTLTGRHCPTVYSQNLAYFHFTQPNYKYNAFPPPPPHTTLSWANRPYY